jgi:hypothetical protein
MNDETTVSIYPPPIRRRRSHRASSLPDNIDTLMSQIYTALDANSRALAVMGARTVLDLVLVEQVGDAGSFPAKLQRAEEAGLINAAAKLNKNTPKRVTV